jgi:hypothetical protein
LEKSGIQMSPRLARRLICIQFWGQKPACRQAGKFPIPLEAEKKNF